MSNKATISPSQFKDGLKRMMEASGKWSTGNTWIGDEPPTESQYAMWVDTSGENDKLRFKTSAGEWKEISGSGSGTGGSSGVAIIPISEDEQTVSSGDECFVEFEWSTLNSDAAKGTVTAYVNSVQKYVKTYEQGRVEIPVQDYLVSGRTNEVKVVVRDIYGSENTYTFYISVITITISSPFKQNTRLEKEKYPEFYSMPVVVKGGLDKIIHVVLDGVELLDNSLPVAAEDAGTTQYVKIPSCSHGSHTLELYATAQLGEDTMRSNSVFYDLLWTEEGNFKTIIVSSFNVKEADQYEILEIPYYVYNPASANSEVFFEINGELLSSEAKLVAQKEEIWNVSGNLVGENVFVIISGDTTKTIKVNLREVETVNVVPVTNAMPVCFVADKLRTNTSEDRDTWTSTGELADLKAEFRNFNWKTNGWQIVNNKGALRISDGASLYIPYHIFEGAIVAGSDTDIKTNGGTIEVDLMFDDVTNVDATFLSCMNEGRGIEITPTKAIIKSSGTYTHTLFADGVSRGTSMRFSFVITPEDPGVMYIYINGIGASASTYTSNDRFKHDSNPVGVTINSDGCSVTLHSFRVYRSALTQQQIIRNWIYDMASVADQVNAHKRNDIYDTTSTSGGILYSKVVERIPCMVITGSMPSYKGEKKIVDIEFEGTKDGLYDFVLKQAQIDVQGTSSQYYPLKNWKFKSEYKIEDDMGNVIEKAKREFEMKDGSVYEYPLADDQIPSKVFCLKADYMESSSTHNTVTANIANGMYSEKTPPQRKDSSGRTRTTIYGRPIIVFYRESEGSELIFGGKYNFNYDKDSEAVFGFVEDNNYEVVECVEFCNNTSERCLLQKSEYINKVDAPAGYDGDDMDANGQIPEYLEDFEFRYQWRRESTNNIKYDYLKAATDWVVSTDRSKATGDLLATPYTTNVGIAVYLYDMDMNIVTFVDNEGRTRRAIDIGLGNLEYAYEEHKVILKDEDDNDIETTYYALPLDEDGLEVYSFTHDTPAYRLTKFKNELSEHFNIHYSLMYYHLIDLLGMIDSSTKNCFWATWGERHEKHPIESGDKVVIWYPIFYDMDTMLGLSNMGKMDIPYNAEFDSLMPGSTTSYVFNGHSNVFWNNIKDAFVTELNTLFRSKVSDGIFSQQAILNAYEEHGENFSESIYNEDGNLKVISPYVDGYYGYSEDSPDEMVMQHPDYVYIYQGDRFYHRRYWFPNRYNYVCSKNMAGSYVTDYITMRLNTPEGELAIPANSNFTVTTYADQYTRVKYGSKTVYSRCEHNIPTEIIAPPDTFNDTETIIYGASRIMSIGSLADKYARSIDLSKASRLTVADIGSDTEGYTNENLDEISFGSNPMLQEVYLQNCSKLSGTLSLSGCPRIRVIKANGTGISLLEVPSVGALEEVILPNTMTSLTLVEHPNLNKFTLDSVPIVDEETGAPIVDKESGKVDYKYNLTSMRIEDTPIDTLDLVEHSPQLTRIRLTGINWNLEDDDILHHIKNNLSGFDSNGKDQDKPVLMGDCEVLNMKDYIEEEMHSYFNNSLPYEELPELSERNFRLTVINSTKTYVVKFFDGVNEEPLYSGILDDRVIEGKSASYSGDIPIKPEDWAKAYEFESWGVYVDGVLTPVNLNTYQIQSNTEFYAIYKEIKKPFVLNFYQKDLVAGTYSLYETATIYYDTSHHTKVFEDNYDNAEYAQIFKGWSVTPDTEVVIPKGGIIAVSEDSPYEQNYYTVYTPEKRTYKITFIDWDGDLLEEITVPYGELPKPNNPTREETPQYFYNFDSWSPTLVTVTGEAVYTATYLPTLRTYTVTWKFGGQTKVTQCAYGSIPAPPSGFEVGTYYTADGLTYTLKSWNVSTVEGNATYTATVQGSGSITSRFSKLSAYKVESFCITEDEWTALLDGTGEAGDTGVTENSGFLYGFDFRKLDGLSNVNITDIKATFSGRAYNKSTTYRKLRIQPITDFEITGAVSNNSTQYTSLTNKENMSFELDITDTAQTTECTRSFTQSDNLKLFITWANANINKLISGYNNNSFGLRLLVAQGFVSDVRLTVDFTFG